MIFQMKYISLRLLLPILIILLTQSCGCEASKDVKKNDNTIRYQIQLIGGKSSSYDRGRIEHLKLPRDFNGRIMSIDLSEIDLSGVNTNNLIPDTVTSMLLSRSWINDKQAKPLKNCKFLNHLNLEATDVSDICLKELSLLEHLKFIDLKYCNISDIGLEYLADIKSLEEVSLSSTHVTAEGIKWFKNKRPDVSILNWTQVPSEKVRLLIIKLLRRGIYVSDANVIKDREYRYSFVFSNFQVPEKRGEEDSKNIISWMNIISANEMCYINLRLASSEVRQVFKNIKLLKNVAKLVLEGSKGTQHAENITDEMHWIDRDMKVMEDYKCRSFSLIDTKAITEKGFQNLAKAKGLEELSLFRCKMSSETVLAISNCKLLQKVSLEDIDFTGSSLVPFTKMKSLVEIEFHNCKGLDPAELKELRILNPKLKISQ